MHRDHPGLRLLPLCPASDAKQHGVTLGTPSQGRCRTGFRVHAKSTCGKPDRGRAPTGFNLAFVPRRREIPLNLNPPPAGLPKRTRSPHHPLNTARTLQPTAGDRGRTPAALNTPYNHSDRLQRNVVVAYSILAVLHLTIHGPFATTDPATSGYTTRKGDELD